MPEPEARSAALFPAFLKLRSRRVLLVGGGRVAETKLGSLLEAGALVTVVAPEMCEGMERPGVTLVRRAFHPDDLQEMWWVVAAAPPDINRQVLAAAETRQLFVNAVDDPDHATAYAGGVVRRAGVTIAISTDGRAPALAGLLREALAACLPDDLEEWMTVADVARRYWRRHGVPMAERRPFLLQVMNKLYEHRGPKSGRQRKVGRVPQDANVQRPVDPAVI